MSKGNVERAGEGYAALSRAIQSGDLDPFFRDYVHPDIEWVPMEGGPDAAVAAGHGPVKARLTAMFEVMENPAVEVEEILGAGERVFIAVLVSGRGRGSGLEMEAHMFHVLTEREGKLARIEWHATRASALEAAGLRE
jgi:ketosteroid isomerase-like protein